MFIIFNIKLMHLHRIMIIMIIYENIAVPVFLPKLIKSMHSSVRMSIYIVLG